MKIKTIAPLFLLLICSNPVYSQTMADFKKAFGEPLGEYSFFRVSENISMIPHFDKSGQVCRVGLFLTESSDLKEKPKAVPFADFKTVVDRIVPVEKRGAKRQQFDTGFTTGGGSMWAVFAYDEVWLVYSASFDPNVFQYAARMEKELDFSKLPPATSQEAADASASKDDFASFKTVAIEDVQINWRNRQCR